MRTQPIGLRPVASMPLMAREARVSFNPRPTLTTGPRSSTVEAFGAGGVERADRAANPLGRDRALTGRRMG
jgi:hypothetical protein